MLRSLEIKLHRLVTW